MIRARRLGFWGQSLTQKNSKTIVKRQRGREREAEERGGGGGEVGRSRRERDCELNGCRLRAREKETTKEKKRSETERERERERSVQSITVAAGQLCDWTRWDGRFERAGKMRRKIWGRPLNWKRVTIDVTWWTFLRAFAQKKTKNIVQQSAVDVQRRLAILRMSWN